MLKGSAMILGVNGCKRRIKSTLHSRGCKGTARMQGFVESVSRRLAIAGSYVACEEKGKYSIPYL